jgi:hypothetical protein
MVEFLSAMSLILGMILNVLSLVVLLMLTGMFVWFLNNMLPESKCQGDCNQGRSCNCKGEM